MSENNIDLQKESEGIYANLISKYTDEKKKKVATIILEIFNKEIFSSNLNNVEETKMIDDAVFIINTCNGEVSHYTVLYDAQFDIFSNSKAIIKEIKESINEDKSTNECIYKLLCFLFLNNVISIYEENDFKNGLSVCRYNQYGYPSIARVDIFIGKVIDFVDYGKKGCIFFANDQSKYVARLQLERLNIVYKQGITLEKLSTEYRSKLDDSIKENNLQIDKLTKISNDNADKTKKDIIKIVSFIVSIVPLLTINIGMLASSFNVISLLITNGVMLLLMSVVYYFVDIIVNRDNKDGTANKDDTKEVKGKWKRWITILVPGIIGILLIAAAFSLGALAVHCEGWKEVLGIITTKP